MEFSRKQRFGITKAVFELPDPVGSYGLVNNRSRRSNRFEDDVVQFYDKDRYDL